MTLQATADSINAQFKKYGLDHDVVEVRNGRRPLVKVVDGEYTYGGMVEEDLSFVDSHDPAAMELLSTTLTHIFDVYFDTHPPSAPLRLF